MPARPINWGRGIGLGAVGVAEIGRLPVAGAGRWSNRRGGRAERLNELGRETSGVGRGVWGEVGRAAGLGVPEEGRGWDGWSIDPFFELP